jgi:hypothetical protein
MGFPLFVVVVFLDRFTKRDLLMLLLMMLLLVALIFAILIFFKGEIPSFAMEEGVVAEEDAARQKLTSNGDAV